MTPESCRWFKTLNHFMIELSICSNKQKIPLDVNPNEFYRIARENAE